MAHAFLVATVICGSLFLPVAVAALDEICVRLEFDSLPTDQGWNFHSSYVEEDHFQVDGTTLYQDTMLLDYGPGRWAYYTYDLNTLDGAPYWRIAMRARVHEYETPTGYGTWCWAFMVSVAMAGYDGTMALDSQYMQFSDDSVQQFDGTDWHDYEILGNMRERTYAIFVDGDQFYYGPMSSHSTTQIALGDGTGDANARAEVSYLEVCFPNIDCNENGVPDQVEIENHPSIDWNDDGVIDNCQQGEYFIRFEGDYEGVFPTSETSRTMEATRQAFQLLPYGLYQDMNCSGSPYTCSNSCPVCILIINGYACKTVAQAGTWNAVGNCGYPSISGAWDVVEMHVSEVHSSPIVEVARLNPSFPNPFNPQTTIAFELPERDAVTLRVFDVGGRLVREMISGEVYNQGRHEAVWNGRDDGGRQLSSGTYFYRLEAGEFSETKRMVLIK